MSVSTWDGLLLQAYLQENGFLVTAANDGTDVFESLNLLGRPIVMLETDLPDVHWAESLERLRREHRNMSILILNSNRSDADMTRAFELGADEVIDPNMDSREVAARIRAVTIRRAGHSGPNLNFGPMRLRMEERRVYWGPQKIDLTPTQYNIFETICLASPYSVSRHVIMAELYGIEEECEPLSINVFISHIRSRLVAAGAPRNAIETVLGRGYRLSQFEPMENVMPLPQGLLVKEPKQLNELASVA
ncbi:MAG: response regulator transcription factor [Aliishimia sp.]